MTKGFIFKYSADTNDPLMRDKLGTTSVCGLGLRDPDFWSNAYPVWAICGPYYRKALDLGDIVFFVPKKAATRKAKLDGYICTGILVVAEKLPNQEYVNVDQRLNPLYKKRYKKDLDAHLERDKAGTKKIRPCNFVLGNPSKSKWFGRNEKYLVTLFSKQPLERTAEKLSLRRIPVLEEEQTRSFYRELMEKDL
jgi:hypothetical protein